MLSVCRHDRELLQNIAENEEEFFPIDKTLLRRAATRRHVISPLNDDLVATSIRLLDLLQDSDRGTDQSCELTWEFLLFEEEKLIFREMCGECMGLP